jgi:hypothetical protein
MRVALISLALTSAGCFRYVPAQLETTTPGEGVRVLVTSQGAVQLAEITDVVEVAPVIDGTVVGIEGQELLLSVPVGRRLDGSMMTNLNQTIRIPTSEIVSFQRREFDALRSGFAVAGAAGLITAVVVLILRPRGGDNLEEEDPPDDLQFDFSILSFPIGR